FRSMPDVKRILEQKTDNSVATVTCEATIYDAAHLMNERRIGSVVVLEGDKVVGILTERDVLTRIVTQQKKPEETLVRDVMTTPVAVASLSTTSDELRAVMRDRRIRHIPIVEAGKLVGLVSIGDLNVAKHQEQEDTIRYLEQYIYKP
ncbi:MAG: CBS domain-containing protein, partial [Phycisphaerales bacterium JB038]